MHRQSANNYQTIYRNKALVYSGNSHSPESSHPHLELVAAPIFTAHSIHEYANAKGSPIFPSTNTPETAAHALAALRTPPSNFNAPIINKSSARYSVLPDSSPKSRGFTARLASGTAGRERGRARRRPARVADALGFAPASARTKRRRLVGSGERARRLYPSGPAHRSRALPA